MKTDRKPRRKTKAADRLVMVFTFPDGRTEMSPVEGWYQVLMESARMVCCDSPDLQRVGQSRLREAARALVDAEVRHIGNVIRAAKPRNDTAARIEKRHQALVARGTPKRNIAGIIAREIGVTPRRVRDVLKKGKSATATCG